VGAGRVRLGREHGRFLATERAAEAVARGQLNLDPCRGGRIRAYVSQDELEKDVLRTEPVELEVLDPYKLKGHKRMINDLRLPIGPSPLLGKHVHIKLKPDPPIGTLAGIKAHP
jgi:hypothetical protein